MPSSTVKNKKLLEDVQLQLAVVQLASCGALLDTRQAAIYLGLAPGTLEVYRSQGVGPPCVFVATRPRYAKETLDAWAAKGRRKKPAKAGAL